MLHVFFTVKVYGVSCFASLSIIGIAFFNVISLESVNSNFKQLLLTLFMVFCVILVDHRA
jgi:hypothetical protein